MLSQRSHQHGEFAGIDLLEAQLLAGHINGHRMASRELSAKDAFGDRRLQFTLDSALERPGAIHRVVADTGESIEGIGVELKAQLLVFQALGQALHLQFHDLPQLLLLEAVEDDRFVEPVEELWAEMAA